MTLISYSVSLSEQLQNSYTQLWRSLKQQFENFDPNLSSDSLLLDRLRSIKNSLVGSKARKLFTITDPIISEQLLILARILQWQSLELNIIYLKIEASAIVGLLSIPEDQAIYALLRADFPAIIIDSITRFLHEIPIQSLLSSQALTRQAEHHLLQTLLRTLSSLYSVVQDVSSPRKWGYMTKSPERVHQPQSSRFKKSKLDHSSSPVTQSQYPDENSSMKVDIKGKNKASIDLDGNVLMVTPPSIHQANEEPTSTFTQDSWPSSNPDKLKEACEHAKNLLSKFIVDGNAIIPLIFALSPPAKCLPAKDSVNNFSLASIADIVIPCFQLIWLICKDTRRQIWLVKKLIEAEDSHEQQEENCLKSLTNCLGIWLRSNHDLAIEYSIRTIGALLSIHEPPSYSGDGNLSDYIDLFVWSQAPPSAPRSNDGMGWVLASKAQECSNPIILSALITSVGLASLISGLGSYSIVSLVKYDVGVRQEILQIEINHTIELMNNSSSPITVRCEAAYALAHALTVSEPSQYDAYEAKAIPVLKKLIDKAFEDPLPYSTPSTHTQNAMLKESAYLALASIMSTLEAPRQEVVELNLIKRFVDSMSDESILVRAASCQCCRALSRGTSYLRNKLIDQGVGNHLFDLAFGIENQNQSDHSPYQGIGLLRVDDQLDHDEDSVEIQLRIIAMGTICNLLLDFLPMKNEMLKRNGVERLIQLLKFSNHQPSKETALWGLKSIIFSSPYSLKLSIVTQLGWDKIRKCLQDKNLSIQENMVSFLRNLVCGEPAEIDILFKHLMKITSHNNSDMQDEEEVPLIEILEDKLSLVVTSPPTFISPSEIATVTYDNDNKIKIDYPVNFNQLDPNCSIKENTLIQSLFLFSNIATGTLSHKTFILHRPKILKAILDALSHPNLDIQCASVWCIINLTHFEEDARPNVVKKTIEKMEEIGIISKLKKNYQEKKLSINKTNYQQHQRQQPYNSPNTGSSCSPNSHIHIHNYFLQNSSSSSSSKLFVVFKSAVDQIRNLKLTFRC